MTAGAGVPPWALAVLDLSDYCAGLLAVIVRDNWHNLVGGVEWARSIVEEIEAKRSAITAALASDAGTPEGERVEGWTGKPGPCPNCGAIRNERDAHFCSSTRSAPASGAAPAPDDPIEELEVMLEDFVDAVRRDDPLHPHFDAIRAHVAQVKREARAAGERAATGEVVGTGTVTGRSWEGGPVPRFAQVSLTVGDASRLPLGTSVSLVLRRDKEGV